MFDRKPGDNLDVGGPFHTSLHSFQMNMLEPVILLDSYECLRFKKYELSCNLCAVVKNGSHL